MRARSDGRSTWRVFCGTRLRSHRHCRLWKCCGLIDTIAREATFERSAGCRSNFRYGVRHKSRHSILFFLSDKINVHYPTGRQSTTKNISKSKSTSIIILLVSFLSIEKCTKSFAWRHLLTVREIDGNGDTQKIHLRQPTSTCPALDFTISTVLLPQI
jgi:hypothetical protein